MANRSNRRLTQEADPTVRPERTPSVALPRLVSAGACDLALSISRGNRPLSLSNIRLRRRLHAATTDHRETKTEHRRQDQILHVCTPFQSFAVALWHTVRIQTDKARPSALEARSNCLLSSVVNDIMTFSLRAAFFELFGLPLFSPLLPSPLPMIRRYFIG